MREPALRERLGAPVVNIDNVESRVVVGVRVVVVGVAAEELRDTV